jgi:hypothetical protein
MTGSGVDGTVKWMAPALHEVHPEDKQWRVCARNARCAARADASRFSASVQAHAHAGRAARPSPRTGLNTESWCGPGAARRAGVGAPTQAIEQRARDVIRKAGPRAWQRGPPACDRTRNGLERVSGARAGDHDASRHPTVTCTSMRCRGCRRVKGGRRPVDDAGAAGVWRRRDDRVVRPSLANARVCRCRSGSSQASTGWRGERSAWMVHSVLSLQARGARCVLYRA